MDSRHWRTLPNDRLGHRGAANVCSIADYWPRIQRIPLYPDWLTDDGDAVICRTDDGQGVVRVTKPERLETDEKREAAIRFYETFYKPSYN
jgi:hypothetical protein